MKRLTAILVVGLVAQLLQSVPLVHAQAANGTGCWSVEKPLVIHFNNGYKHDLSTSCELLRFVPHHGQTVVVTGYFSVAVSSHGKTHWLRSDRKGHNLLFSIRSVIVGVSAPVGKGITYALPSYVPFMITKELRYISHYLVARDHTSYLVTAIYNGGWEQYYVNQ